MSPTMTEGGIASWKKKEGESFSAGDVLLEIETDKATIDVEAQEDGVVGKILAPDGTKGVPVGKLIALLAEDGDDISNLEIPKEEPAQQSSNASSSSEAPPAPTSSSGGVQPSNSQPQHQDTHTHVLPEHSRPLFPSVHRLLLEHGVSNPSQIPGTGVRGMLTKGDVLTFLGLASSPLGTFKPGPTPIQEAIKAGSSGAPKKPEEAKLLDGPSIRRLIVSNMLQGSMKARNPTPGTNVDVDSIIADYLPKAAPSKSPAATSSQSAPLKATNEFEGLY
ncbi:hypothetical protein CVT24_009562 [Panaeolus cyanescens]|uniref:Lipoyl-binding domain-containing protein n=1 Tax=Panaeolus cyanescens TaxID=181874 RepID=A0A409YA93_9AGAR|nr:hypothetical protein CVT24_009562 [Panaeolus cyanescens]